MIRLGRLGVVHQSHSLCRYSYSGKGREVCLARLARCGTPIPHLLSVTNIVQAWNLNKFVAGEGVADVRGLIERILRRYFEVGDAWCVL